MRSSLRLAAYGCLVYGSLALLPYAAWGTQSTKAGKPATASPVEGQAKSPRADSAPSQNAAVPRPDGNETQSAAAQDSSKASGAANDSARVPGDSTRTLAHQQLDNTPQLVTEPIVSRSVPLMVWYALAAGVLGILFGLFALWNNHSAIKKLYASLPRQPHSQIPQFPVPAVQSDTRSNATADLFDLRGRIQDLEAQVQRLREALEKPAATVKTPTPDPRPRRSIEEPVPPMHTAQVLAGLLSGDDQVRASTSSKPMVHIHWQPASSTAEVYVNTEYKFADLTADYLVSIFQVESSGPGSYETLAPAVITWSKDAAAGKVQRRGRIAAIGA